MASETVGMVRYTEKLSRGGALLPEMRTLLKCWEPGEAGADLTKRVLRDGLLGKATARTVKDYTGAFTRRFLTPVDTPARHLRQLITGNPPRQVFEDLAYYYTAREDTLLHDFALLRYWPAAREGRLTVSNEAVLRFIWEAEQDGRIPEPWADSVKRDLPARVLNALADFGLLGARKVGRREIVAYRPADGTVLYLAHLLHAFGVTDASLAEHSDWSIFGLDASDVWHRLEMLAGDGWFIIQRAGQVARVTWKHQTPEEVVDALAGR